MSQNLPEASPALLSTVDDNPSTALPPSKARGHSAPGKRHNSKDPARDRLPSHTCSHIDQESSFATTTRTGDILYNEHDDTSMLKPSLSSAQNPPFSRSAAGGSSSFVSSFLCSMLVCCGNPNWDNGVDSGMDVGASPSPHKQPQARSAAGHSSKLRSESFQKDRPRARDMTRMKHQTGPRMGPLGDESGSDYDDKSAADGSQVAMGGSSATRGTSATVMAPRTPSADIASGSLQVASGTVSSRRSRSGRDALKNVPGDSRENPPSSVGSVSRPHKPSSRRQSASCAPAGTSNTPTSQAIRATTSNDPSIRGTKASCTNTESCEPTAAPHLSRRQNSGNLNGRVSDLNLNLSSHTKLKWDGGGIDSLTDAAPAGASQQRGRDRGGDGGFGKGPDEFNSVYFFAPGLGTDSEAGDSNVIGMVGASSKIDAILSSTPGAGVSVTQMKSSTAAGVELASTPSRRASKEQATPRHHFSLQPPSSPLPGDSRAPSEAHNRNAAAVPPVATPSTKPSGLNPEPHQGHSGTARGDLFHSAEAPAPTGTFSAFRSLDGTVDYVNESEFKHAFGGESSAVHGESSGGGAGNPIPGACATEDTPGSTIFEPSGMEDSDGSESQKPPGLDPEEEVDWRLDRLCEKLDGIWQRKQKILGRYILEGPDGRRQGGQAVVQFGRNVRDGHSYAIKLYVSRSAFEAEKKLYRDKVLSPLLPHMAECNDGGHVASGGRNSTRKYVKLPPFIVVEKGEALDEFVQRAQPDMYQSVAILANISKRLVHLHNAGYVHRDLKPSNFLWLPRQNRWTVIDFGSVARSGALTDMSFSLRYAAPEVVDAVHRGERQMLPDSSQDVWSLGVTAFELLTGVPAFEIATEDTREVLQQLIGDEELPWEGSRAVAGAKYMRKLRGLRGPVLKLLNRNPLHRPIMAQFCAMCDSIFSTRTDLHVERASSPSAQPPATADPKPAAAKRGKRRSAAPAGASGSSSGKVRARGRGRKPAHGVSSGDINSADMKLSRRHSRVEELYGSPENSNDLDGDSPQATTGTPARHSDRRAGASGKQGRGRASMSLVQLQAMQSRRQGCSGPNHLHTETPQNARDAALNRTETSKLDYDGDAELSDTRSAQSAAENSAKRSSRAAQKVPRKQSNAISQKRSSDPRKAATPKLTRMHSQLGDPPPSSPKGTSLRFSPQKPSNDGSKGNLDDISGHRSIQSEHSSSAVFATAQSQMARGVQGASVVTVCEDLPEEDSLGVQGGTPTAAGLSPEYAGTKAPLSLGVRSARHSTCQSDRSTLQHTPSNSKLPASGSRVSSAPVATATGSGSSLSPSRHAFVRNTSNASGGTPVVADISRRSSCADTERQLSQPLLMQSMHTRGGESTGDDVKHRIDLHNPQEPQDPAQHPGFSQPDGSSAGGICAMQPARAISAPTTTRRGDSKKHKVHTANATARSREAPQLSGLHEYSTTRSMTRGDSEVMHGALPDDFSTLPETPIGEPTSNPILTYNTVGERSPRSNILWDSGPRSVRDMTKPNPASKPRRGASREESAAQVEGRSRSLSDSLRSTGLSIQELIQQHSHQPPAAMHGPNAFLPGRPHNSQIVDGMFSLPHTPSRSAKHASGPHSGSSGKRMHGASGHSVHRQQVRSGELQSTPSSSMNPAATGQYPFADAALSPKSASSHHAGAAHAMHALQVPAQEEGFDFARPPVRVSMDTHACNAFGGSASDWADRPEGGSGAVRGMQSSQHSIALISSTAGKGESIGERHDVLRRTSTHSPHHISSKFAQNSDSDVLAAAMNVMHGRHAWDGPKSGGSRRIVAAASRGSSSGMHAMHATVPSQLQNDLEPCSTAVSARPRGTGMHETRGRVDQMPHTSHAYAMRPLTVGDSRSPQHSAIHAESQVKQNPRASSGHRGAGRTPSSVGTMMSELEGWQNRVHAQHASSSVSRIRKPGKQRSSMHGSHVQLAASTPKSTRAKGDRETCGPHEGGVREAKVHGHGESPHSRATQNVIQSSANFAENPVLLWMQHRDEHGAEDSSMM